MTMYKVIHSFGDSHDRNHIYQVGDKFPRSNKKVKKERIDELKSSKNIIGVPLIIEVGEE